MQHQKLDDSSVLKSIELKEASINSFTVDREARNKILADEAVATTEYFRKKIASVIKAYNVGKRGRIFYTRSYFSQAQLAEFKKMIVDVGIPCEVGMKKNIRRKKYNKNAMTVRFVDA